MTLMNNNVNNFLTDVSTVATGTFCNKELVDPHKKTTSTHLYSKNKTLNQLKHIFDNGILNKVIRKIIIINTYYRNFRAEKICIVCVCHSF